MNRQNKSLMMGLLLLCAVACYAFGLTLGAFVIVAIGAVFELTVWGVGFRSYRNKTKLMPTEFRCFNCRATINEGDEKCPECGWMWEAG
jgi:hypothetical protein